MGAHTSTTFAERWDGSNWTIVPSPNPPGVGVPYTWAALHSVSCATATSCLAVGAYTINGSTRTLSERWDGSTWTIVPSPNPPGINFPGVRVELSGVSCSGATNCVAVGFTQTSVSRTLVEHWNGTTWVIVPSPNVGGSWVSTLSGVSCPSAQSCFAVGTYSVVDGLSHALIEHWNGNTWGVVPSHEPTGALVNQLNSVSCMSTTTCVAVGSFATSSSRQQPLVQQGNASSWSVVSGAKPSSATASWLTGSSCAKPAPCFAVGTYERAGLSHAWVALSASPPPGAGSGYWMLGADGSIYPFGTAKYCGAPNIFLDFGEYGTDIAPTPDGLGYWTLNGRDKVEFFACSTMPALDRNSYEKTNFFADRLRAGEAPISMSALPDGTGYWVFTNLGRALAFGKAPWYGDMGNVNLTGPVVGSVATPSGHGYYMVAADGGIFTFGDARFLGSMGGVHLNQPVVSMAPTPNGRGYWLVASDGGVFTFGAPFYGSMGAVRLNAPMVGIVAGPTGRGYLMIGSDGGVFTFGDARFHGSLGSHPPNLPITAVAVVPRVLQT
jgi:hypothetical protein